MDDSANGPVANAKAQLVEKLRSATNILVTVSANPTVDQLSACIATTLLLNKYKKNATAVFSGKIPPLLNFLKPADTIEKSTDSLRDFIIALDKSKADKLRYKVEDDVVKIFITPYKTSITQKDFKYSAGDFNVDLILALGVHHQQDLDRAITAHGRIFHDAVTMSINNQPGGDFGTVNWEDLEASSLSELIANLAGDLDGNLLDADIATALLTGIVAETSRFSNEKTHPRTMNVSSILLQAGADQKLVNTQLQDLIGTVVNLEAGTEIKPTADTSQEPLHHNDAEDELVIDGNGSFLKADGGQKPSAAPTEKADDKAKNDKETGAPVSELPELSKASPVSDTDSKPAEVPTSIEELLGTSVESTAAPVLDENKSDEKLPELVAGNKPEPVQPVAGPDDTDEARKAVENALGTESNSNSAASTASADNNGAETFDLKNLGIEVSEPETSGSGTAAPAPSGQPSSPVQPSPLIQPIAPNQPSYANPATMTEYDMPVTPAHEPAPLGMSPADQAFTMPLPPTSSMPAQQPAVMAAQPPAGPTPPPLPPPVMPPNFG